MAVTSSAGVITVTGTETSLANFTGLTGVTTTALGNKTLYVLDTSRLVVTGSLIIDPDVECLYLKANVAYPCITYNGTLQIGRKRTSGSRILYSTGDAIIIGRQATTDFDTDTYAGICSKANGSAFIGYGGSIKTKSPVSFGGTLNTKYTGSVNIESLDMFQGAAANAAAAQVRFDLSAGQTINVKGLRLSCDVDNVTLRNVLLFATDFTSFAAQFAAFTLQNFSSSSVDLTFDNLEFANNYVTYDIFGNSANNVASTPIYTLRNTDVGTATRAWGNTNTDAVRMNWLFTQVVTVTLLDAAGSPITANAGLYINETDDGNRFQPVQGRSGFTWTTVESYLPTPNGSGIATATVRTGIKKWYGLTSPLTTTITQSYFGKSSADDFDVHFFGYLYLPNVRTEILRGTGGTSFKWAQLSDSYITQTNRTTVNAYTEISNLDRLYDRYKSWFVSNFSTAYPSIGQQKINGNGDTLDLSNANLVVDGTAASAFAINTGTNTITIKATAFAAGTKFAYIRSTSGSITLANAAAPSCGVDLDGANLIAQDIDAVTGVIATTGTCRIDVAAPGVYPAAAINATSKIRVTAATSGDIHDCRACVFTSGAVFENNSGQPITVKLLPAQTTPTKLETSGAITFDNVASATLTVDGIVDQSRLLIEKISDGSVLVNAVVSGTSYAYNYAVTADVPVLVRLRKASAAPFYQPWDAVVTLTANNNTVTAAQQLDT
jgi:hypothetical protein